jgi:nanoRNase/pAp phosphatase (c-di-AMP/oligoRNAs hydrolase)
MDNHNQPHRLVTRNDMNGLACAALLYFLNLIDDVVFVHPREIESGKFQLAEKDITANLPYIEKVHLAFQHRVDRSNQPTTQHSNYVINTEVESTARVIYDYYGGKEKIPNLLGIVVTSADKASGARYTVEEVLNPRDWDLLSFVLDPQTGLGRFKDFQVSTNDLIKILSRLCSTEDIEDILARPAVKERVDLYLEQERSFDDQIRRCVSIYKDLLVIDLRGESIIYAGNRFRAYALYPSTNISMQITLDIARKIIVLSVGQSIINRSSKIDIGDVMRQYGGGGHANAGSCQIDEKDFESIKSAIVDRLV